MSSSNKEPGSKYPLSIRLAESVVFLRSSRDPTHPRRRHVATADAPPAMLRGLLTLHLSKPTRISSIEILLDGKSTIQWPEGSSHRRADAPEENTFLSARTLFFSAKSCPASNRSASLGPASRISDEDLPDFHNDSHPGSPRFSHHPRPSLDYSSLHPIPPLERRNSAGNYPPQPHPVLHDMHESLSPDHLPTPPLSPPYTPIPPVSELPVVSRPQTPIDSHPGSSHHRARSIRAEDSPGQMLEDFRNALRMEIGGPSRSASGSFIPNPDVAAESSDLTLVSLTATSPPSVSAPASRSASRDVDHRYSRPNSIPVQAPTIHHRRTVSPSPSASPSTPPAFIPSLPEFDHSQLRDKRSSSRWSISNMSSVFKDAKDKLRTVSKETELPRGRTPERHGFAEHRVDFIVTPDDGERKRREKERKGALGKLTAAVGFDEPSHVENWKEFRKGTYSYPVSFAIPSTSPPTVHCDFGAVVYRLKAVVHRPGALTSKLTATRQVTLVAYSDDDTEDTHSITVERQWDNQLRYLIALSGRSFVIGSKVPFNLTLVPMAKCKIYRLSVFLEEKNEYHIQHKQMTREQPVKRFELLSIRHSEKNSPPILPSGPDSASLFMPYLDTSSFTSSTDEALSSLMGPGPWILSHDLQLPAECGKIHFTYKHKGSSISVSHILKIVFRVERGDDQALDPKTGKRRLFDIVVQTPIHILSCHCNPEWISLPRYSLFEPAPDDNPLAPSGPVCACSGDVAPSLSTFTRYQTSPVGTPPNSRPTTAEWRTSSSAPSFAFPDGLPATMHQPPSHLASSSYQFARLMSGEEGVLGDAPPRYQEVLARGQ